MKIETVVVGELSTNCYIVHSDGSKDAAVIDPGASADKIMKAVTDLRLNVLYMLHTHGHPDHFDATEKIRQKTGAEVLAHEADAPILESVLLSLRGAFINPTKVGRRLKDGDVISFSDVSLEVIHTPGHSRGGVCYYSKTDGVLFSGDTLFAGNWGRTDLPGGSGRDMLLSLKKLMTLPDDTRVFPGHGESTTIARERESLRL